MDYLRVRGDRFVKSGEADWLFPFAFDTSGCGNRSESDATICLMSPRLAHRPTCVARVGPKARDCRADLTGTDHGSASMTALEEDRVNARPHRVGISVSEAACHHFVIVWRIDSTNRRPQGSH
jgi:hypothetical protein